ncbi:purine phosphoribosyltransferase family protein Apf isoform X2 [Rhynchophorus ferrugineus]|uniref:purine phosphoribosyltransferase family protein Apf isoform X2 n=1 Tax=Rhynchophorus ferrugineus TaxID=354439 RepID=UPI003FCC9F43
MEKIAAGFVLFRRASNHLEYLLLQTAYGKNHWSPPKEQGESELDTAYRETLEESGINKSDIKVYEDTKRTLNYMVEGKPKIVHYWLAEVNDETDVIMSDEHQDFYWLQIQDACDLAEFKNMQDLLLEYDNFIKKSL